MTNFSSSDHPRADTGEFVDKPQSAPETALAAPKPARDVLAYDLKPGDVLSSLSGARLRVDNVEESSVMPGFMAVETAFGTLYLEAEMLSAVAAEDEHRVNIDPATANYGELAKALRAVIEPLGLRGDWVDRGEAEFRLIEEPGFYYLDEEAISAHIDHFGSKEKFIQAVIGTNAWADLDEAGDESNDRVTKALVAALDELETSVQS
jgi:hypothetical protein